MFKINQVFLRLFLLFAISLFVFFIIIYFSLKPQLELIEAYNQIWIKLGVVSLFVLSFIYFIIKKMSDKLSQDIKEFLNYLEEVSNKNYQAVIKIKYFYEFLEMSLRLKNIVKRLNNKDSKKK